MKINNNRIKKSIVKGEHKFCTSTNTFSQIKITANESAKIDTLIASGMSIYSIYMRTCRANDNSLIKSILNRGELTEQEIMNGFIISSTFDCVNTAAEIFKHGINVHYNSDEPLRIAVRTGSINIVKFLISNGANVKANYYEPMVLAKAKNNKEMIELLMANNGSLPSPISISNVNKIENSIVSTSPIIQLSKACSNKDYDMASKILSNYPNILKNGNYLISEAIKNKDLRLFKIMVPYGVNVKDMYLFATACETADISILKYFINNGAQKINITLSYTCKSGSIKAVAFIMKNYIFTQDDINNAFSYVVKETKINKKRMLKFLLLKGADIDNGYNTPLKNALETSDYKIINMLIKLGAKPHYIIGLESAARKNDLKIIKYILRKSNLEEVKFELKYSLISAIYYAHYTVAEYLIKKGADVLYASEVVIVAAINQNKPDHLDFLFNHGVNFKGTSVKIFIDAVKKKAFNVVQYFLDKGLIVTAKNAAPLLNLFQSSYLRLREKEYTFGNDEVNLINIGKKAISNNIEVYFDNVKMDFVKAIKSQNIIQLKSLFKKYKADDVFLFKLLLIASSPKKYSAKIVLFLLSQIKNLSSINDETLQNLFTTNNTNIIQNLIKKGLNTKEKIGPILAGLLFSDNINIFKKLPWEKFVFFRAKIFAFSVYTNSVKILSYFLKKKFDIKKYNYMALFMGVISGNVNILKILVSYGATFHPFEKKYLTLAYDHRHPEVLRYLIEEAKINLTELPEHIRSYYLLWHDIKPLSYMEGSNKQNFSENFNNYINHEAILIEDVHKIKIRYQKTIFPFIYTLSDDIFFAITSNRLLAAEYLLSIAMPDLINSILLRFLLASKFYEARFVVLRGAKVNFENNKPLLLACLRNDIPFIEFLIQNGLKIHPDVDDGLQKSLNNECYESANYLLSRGADIHFNEDCIIQSACSSQNEKLLKYLISTKKFDKESIIKNIEYSISNDKFFSAKVLLQSLQN